MTTITQEEIEFNTMILEIPKVELAMLSDQGNQTMLYHLFTEDFDAIYEQFPGIDASGVVDTVLENFRELFPDHRAITYDTEVGGAVYCAINDILHYRTDVVSDDDDTVLNLIERMVMMFRLGLVDNATEFNWSIAPWAPVEE